MGIEIKGDPARGEGLLADWVEPVDLRSMQESMFSECRLMIGRYTGGRLSQEKLSDASAALLVLLASKFTPIEEK